MDVFKYLSDMVASIKRLGSILAGDEVGDGWSWQRVALYQAHEMRHYAEVLERVAAGKHGGGIVFPSWDEGGDGVDSPVPPLEIKGVPTEKVADWVAGLRSDCEQRGDLIMRMDDRVANMKAGAWELQRSYSQAKAALAAAAVALLEGADALAKHGDETSAPMGCLAVEARMRTVHGLVVATIEGRNEKPANPPCCICGKAIESEGDWHSGHNAEPVAKGRCCRRCNDNVVVPARLREFMHRTAPKS